ncbi:hypothetical protein CBR_g32410 [Chara braunii]|uniref:Uncharacterized protein n=1 Tax=Chara braunii TaxID=69332 RepID=A0A388JYI6_CHABU|nr:hypothetical protein CBR_g32410 [Chara braunii]|eukprot:GBG62827.1 hypothetical protein CBR_g32410 [Chara braunii]
MRRSPVAWPWTGARRLAGYSDSILASEEISRSMAVDWGAKGEQSDATPTDKQLAVVMVRVVDLLATCALQQEKILNLTQANAAKDDVIATLNKSVFDLEQGPIVANVGLSNIPDRVNALEVKVDTSEVADTNLDKRLTAIAFHQPPNESSSHLPKLDGITIFKDLSENDPIPWWTQFTLWLDMLEVTPTPQPGCLYSRAVHVKHSWTT